MTSVRWPDGGWWRGSASSKGKLEAALSPLNFWISPRHAATELVVRGKQNLLQICQEQLWSILHPAMSPVGVERFLWRGAWLVKHFSSHDIAGHLWHDIAKDTLCLAAVVWARLEVIFSSYPWKLLEFGIMAFAEFAGTPNCCLDSGFSKVLRRSVALLTSFGTSVIR